jgi:hypothetical protein
MKNLVLGHHKINDTVDGSKSGPSDRIANYAHSELGFTGNHELYSVYRVEAQTTAEKGTVGINFVWFPADVQLID